jgi:glutathione synthase
MSAALLFVADPLSSFKIHKDTTFAMMREAQSRGLQVWACEPHDLQILQGKVSVQAKRIVLTGHASEWYEIEVEEGVEVTRFAAIIMRKDPPFDMEYLYSTFVLERAQQQGVMVLNDPAALRNHNEKLAITEFPQLTSPTLVTRSPEALRAFVHDHEHAIFKLLDGMGGASIFRADANDPNLSVIIETMNQFGARSVMAQRYLPAISLGDKRILLIDGQVVPYCLARIPKAGEARGNLAAGGTGVVQPLSPRDREIASALAPVLAARGLFLVGLDVIGDSLTEINVTSPTCFQEITQGSDCDVAAMFIDALMKRLQRT